MPFNLDRLKEIIHDLAARLDLQPTYGWAVVTSLTPLQIRYDAQTEAIAGTPDTLFPVHWLSVGDRVFCMRLFRRDIVFGRGGGPVAQSGVLIQATGALSQVGTTQVYAATVSVVFPVVTPAGWYLKVSCLNVGTGYGTVSQVGQIPGLTSTTVNLRFTQVGNSQAQNLSLHWELVKPMHTP